MKREFCYKKGKYQDDTYVVVKENSILIKQWWYGGVKYELKEINLTDAQYLSDQTIADYINMYYTLHDEAKKNELNCLRKKIASGNYNIIDHSQDGYLAELNGLKTRIPYVMPNEKPEDISFENFYASQIKEAAKIVESWKNIPDLNPII